MQNPLMERSIRLVDLHSHSHLHGAVCSQRADRTFPPSHPIAHRGWLISDSDQGVRLWDEFYHCPISVAGDLLSRLTSAGDRACCGTASQCMRLHDDHHLRVQLSLYRSYRSNAPTCMMATVLEPSTNSARTHAGCFERCREPLKSKTARASEASWCGASLLHLQLRQ